MEKIAISKFKARCLAILEQVGRTRNPVLITRFGEPVAQVVPPPLAPRPKSWLGDLANTGQILGDIVAPASDKSDWEVLQS